MTQPQRELSAFDIGCVVVGGIIGVGIFFTPQRVAEAVDTPGQVLLAWGFGGFLAVLGAIVFAELSLAVPGHGGMFRYLERAFGPTVAFLYGWANWLVIQAGAAGIVGLILFDYLNKAVAPTVPWSDSLKVIGAGAVILLFTTINVFGLRTGKRVQNALTVLKVLALLLLVTLAWFAPGAEQPVELPEPSGRSLPAMMAAAMLPVLFAIGGWQQGSFVAGAARHRLSVALGVLGGVAVVVVTYLTVNLAYLDLLGFEGARSSSAIGADAAEVVFGEIGGRVLATMVVVSAAGILNTICLAPPYVLYAMAKSGCFPRAFGVLHVRWNTPVLAVLSQGGWAVLLLFGAHFGVHWFDDGATVDTLDFICTGVVHVDWLFFMLCGIALLRLRRSGDAARLPFGGVAAVAFALGAAAVTLGAFLTETTAAVVGTLVVLVGWLFRPGRRATG